MIEYDLVVIGATELGCQMALRARKMGARVAIVAQGAGPNESMVYDRTSTIAFRQWCLSLDQSELEKSAAIAIELADECYSVSPEALQLQGVDYLAGSGSWIDQPKPGFLVQERLLRSTNFVSALTPKRRIPVALWKIPCRFPEEFPLDEPLPERAAIVGEAIVGIELAMALSRRGVQVVLIVPTAQILPQMPSSGAFRVQVMLEAAGIQVLPETRLRSAENLHDKIQLQLSNRNSERNVEVDQVILATAFERLEPECLGLRSLSGPAVRRLHLRLVGSGKRSGLDSFDGLTSNPGTIALAEVQRILMPWKRFRSIPAGRLMNPPAVWIGKPSAGEVDRHTGKYLPDLYQFTNKLTNGQLWYDLKLTKKGQLISAVLIGELANQFATLLGLMMQHRVPIDQLLTLSIGEPKQTQVIQQWIEEWEMRSRPSLRHELFLDGLAFWRRRSR
jgi:Pyridine nucleotide-disulphide oxidoreductase